MDSKKYFFLARTEEQLNCDAAALLLYLSSFCSSLEEGPASLSAGTINKIAHLRKKLSLSVREFLPLVHTYSDILTGIILFFIIGCEFFITYRLQFRKKTEKEEQ